MTLLALHPTLLPARLVYLQNGQMGVVVHEGGGPVGGLWTVIMQTVSAA